MELQHFSITSVLKTLELKEERGDAHAQICSGAELEMTAAVCSRGSLLSRQLGIKITVYTHVNTNKEFQNGVISLNALDQINRSQLR